jgi:SRSO17 transposase
VRKRRAIPVPGASRPFWVEDGGTLTRCATSSREYALETLADQDAVLVLDETGFLKQGKACCGVARQYTGSAGKITNCQIGVFCAYVSRHGDAFIDRALYLPKAWTDDPIRMTATHVPNGIAFATKPALAVKMISHALAVNVPFSWVAADSVYGVGDIEMALRHAGKGYVLGVSANRHFGSWRGKLARQAGAASRRSPARPRKSRRVWLPRLGAVFRRAKARKAQGSTIGLIASWPILTPPNMMRNDQVYGRGAC